MEELISHVCVWEHVWMSEEQSKSPSVYSWSIWFVHVCAELITHDQTTTSDLQHVSPAWPSAEEMTIICVQSCSKKNSFHTCRCLCFTAAVFNTKSVARVFPVSWLAVIMSSELCWTVGEVVLQLRWPQRNQNALQPQDILLLLCHYRSVMCNQLEFRRGHIGSLRGAVKRHSGKCGKWPSNI